MTEVPSYISQWCAELVSSANRHSIVFAPLGVAFDSVRSICLNHFPIVMSASQYLAEEFPGTDLRKTVAIDDTEEFCKGLSGQLGLLRSRIHADYERGAKFILFSRIPREAFPDVPGSSILLDAKLIAPPLAASTTGITTTYTLPADNGEGLTRSLAADVLADLGIDILIALDSIIFENMAGPDDALDEIVRAGRSIDTLRSAGLVHTLNGNIEWTYRSAFSAFRLGLSDAISTYTSPPQMITEAFGVIWEIERMIRRAMRQQVVAMVEKPSWQASALPADMAEQVLERATREAYLASKSIKEIRDPLEWLTLGELIEVRLRMPGVYGDLGVSRSIWKSFSAEVPSIRNSLSHMRLIRDSDLTTLRKWQRALARKLLQ